MEQAIEHVKPTMPVEFPWEVDITKAFEAKKNVQDAETEGTWIVEGFASTGDLDAQDHRISKEAIQEGADSLQEYNTLLYNHDPDKPIGKILKAEARDGRLWIKTSISKMEPVIWGKIMDGTLSKFSIKGQILDSEQVKDEETQKDITMITSMSLFEVSVVSVPANVKAKSLAWYIEKALAKAASEKDQSAEKEISDSTGKMSVCVANRASTLIESGMAKEKALVEAARQCAAEQAGDVSGAEKAGHRDGNGMASCVANRAARNRAQGMDAQAARREALEHCKTQKAADEADEETLDKLVAEYPWLVDVIDKVEAKIEEEGGVQEDMKISKDASDGIQNAVTSLEGTLDKLEGEHKEQVGAVINSLNALLAGSGEAEKDVKPEGDGAGEAAKTVVTKEEEKDEKIETSAEEGKKEEVIDIAALTKILTDKVDEALKSIRDALEEIRAAKTETKEASVAAVTAKETIEKTKKQVDAVVEQIPLRKGQGPEVEGTDDDRTGEDDKRDLKKRVVDEVGKEEYDNANPGKKLQMLLEEQLKG